VGYAGEKPLVPTVSPVDLVGPAAARGLWALGGRVCGWAQRQRARPPTSTPKRSPRVIGLLESLRPSGTPRDGCRRVLPMSGRVSAGASRGGGRGCAEGYVARRLGILVIFSLHQLYGRERGRRLMCDPNGGPYRLVAEPVVPTQADALPPAIGSMATRIKCSARFGIDAVVSSEMVDGSS
jgi:hypothetical protein